MKFCTGDLEKQWPRIGLYLEVQESGWIKDRLLMWLHHEVKMSPEDRVAGYDEWADYFEWQLTLRTEELAADPAKRRFVEHGNAEMVARCRQAAARAREAAAAQCQPFRDARPRLHLRPGENSLDLLDRDDRI